MKITFEGSMREFQQLFGGVVGGIAEEPLVPEYLDDAKPIELPGEPVEDRQADEVEGLPELTAEQRADSESYFADFCGTWVKGFGNYDDPDQPDRLGMIRKLGSGKNLIPLLIRAYEIGSLQRLVEEGFNKHSPVHRMAYPKEEDWLDFCDLIAANMVQISHMGAPDLAGTYDYSTKWRN